MRTYPELGDFQPLFIVGMPRSGTRYVTNALNVHPDVTIGNELPSKAVDGARHLIDKLDAEFQRRGTYEQWVSRRAHLLTAIWANATKGESKDLSGVAWAGYKTPGHQRCFDLYEKVFEATPPRWIFCLRNFPDTYRSLSQMPWHPSPLSSIVGIGAEYAWALRTVARP